MAAVKSFIQAAYVPIPKLYGLKNAEPKEENSKTAGKLKKRTLTGYDAVTGIIKLKLIRIKSGIKFVTFLTPVLYKPF